MADVKDLKKVLDVNGDGKVDLKDAQEAAKKVGIDDIGDVKDMAKKAGINDLSDVAGLAKKAGVDVSSLGDVAGKILGGKK